MRATLPQQTKHVGLALMVAAVAALQPPSAFSGRGEGDEARRRLHPAAIAVPLFAGGSTSVYLARRSVRHPVDAGDETLGADFSGRWRLDRSENFDAYLRSMNVTATQRGFATRASVEHRIRRWSEGSGTRYEMCVVNRLGSKCESFVVGNEPTVIESSDARGEPITKHIDWEDQTKQVLVTRVDSVVGRLVDKRRLTSRDEMVMELVSPTQVRAYRIFSRVASPPHVSSSASRS